MSGSIGVGVAWVVSDERVGGELPKVYQRVEGGMRKENTHAEGLPNMGVPSRRKEGGREDECEADVERKVLEEK